VCLTLGTGIGGGLIVHGRLDRGASGSAGEIGHMTIVPDGRRCACGSRGCLETLIGSSAVVREGRAALRRGSSRLTPELLSRAARAGDRAARQVWVRFGEWLGIGVANLVNLLNPDRVVIGGGIARAWPLFYPSLARTVRARAMEVPARAARIVRGQLGDQAGIIGGAVLVWQQEEP
jgi:glucokinase